MRTDELRKTYLSFFAEKDHTVVASDSLIPHDDPSVLFTSAGMNQFKKHFLGQAGGLRRATSCQKCLRTDDLDKVGKTPCHHTFFEMLGNFSFGDYFKEEAIMWAWEFLTARLNLKGDHLWVSVYKDDEEAYRIWAEKIAVPRERILKLGDSDNFWPANAPQQGPNGPCGPCSEIFFDQGPSFGCGRPACSPDCGCGRFVEVWNLVFTQFNRQGPLDKMGELLPLPRKNIDTGMGLERMAAVLQGVASNFQIDIFSPITRRVREELLKRVKAGQELPEALVYVIADHIRAIVFAISDGALPSQEGRGYVVRKLVRLCLWQARSQVGAEKPFLSSLVGEVVKAMQAAYPELEESQERTRKILQMEEGQFQDTVSKGYDLLQKEIQNLRSEKKTVIPGKFVFYISDTAGFPMELTALEAERHNLTIDWEECKTLMSKQKDLSRSSSALAEEIFRSKVFNFPPTEFLDSLLPAPQAKILALLKDQNQVSFLRKGDEGVVILDKTPFYAEAGGQIGDTGVLSLEERGEKAQFMVKDTRREGGVFFHQGQVLEGELRTGQMVQTKVDVNRREAIQRSHTATHLLQAALREVLGTHVQQSGSLVEPDRLRFDFTHLKELTPEELAQVFRKVNTYIQQDLSVSTRLSSLEAAKKGGALAFFGEKYQEEVRVVSIGDYSQELCGGTHLVSTGRIGLFLLIGESSVSRGVRRIEAVVGRLALEQVYRHQQLLRSCHEDFKISADNLWEEFKSRLQEIKYWQKKWREVRLKLLDKELRDLLERVETIGAWRVLIAKLSEADAQILRQAIDALKERFPSQALFILGSRFENRAYLVCGLSGQDKETKLSAAVLLGQITRACDGQAGGREDLAQGGLKNADDLERALDVSREVVKRSIGL